MAERTKDELIAEAKARGIVVTRADGDTDKEPTKEDYVAALRASAPVKESDGLVASVGRSSIDDNEDRPRRVSEKERLERAHERAKNSIRVVATRRGEYPAGQLRRAGEEFPYELTEQDKESKSIPSWLEAVEDEKFERRPVPSELAGNPTE